MGWSKQEVEALVAHACDMESAPRPDAAEDVELKGEALRQPIYWTGRQWAVTEFGIEARNGTYPIPKRRIWDEENEFGWVQQLAAKAWIDLPDFAEALRLARQRWAPVNPYQKK